MIPSCQHDVPALQDLDQLPVGHAVLQYPRGTFSDAEQVVTVMSQTQNAMVRLLRHSNGYLLKEHYLSFAIGKKDYYQLARTSLTS